MRNLRKSLTKKFIKKKEPLEEDGLDKFRKKRIFGNGRERLYLLPRNAISRGYVFENDWVPNPIFFPFIQIWIIEKFHRIMYRISIPFSPKQQAASAGSW